MRPRWWHVFLAAYENTVDLRQTHVNIYEMKKVIDREKLTFDYASVRPITLNETFKRTK